MSRISLVGGTVATPTDEGARIAEATVVVEDGLIVDVGPVGAAGQVIDCRGKLVLPGFVNAHAHTTEVLYKGLGGDLDHLDWVDRKHALQHALDVGGAEAGARLACLEMLRSGAVAFLDPEVEPGHFDGIARAAAESGLRANLAVAIQARHGYGVPADAADHDAARNDAAHADAHPPASHDHDAGGGEHHHQAATQAVHLPAAVGRVKPWLGPRSMSALTAELAEAVARQAREPDAWLTFHCAEDTRDVDAVRAEAGVTPARFAERAGLLIDRAVLAHGVYLEPDDLVAIAQAGSTIVHCPSSNAKTGKGIAALPAMRAAGINVAIGTDGGMSNDTYDMLLELRLVGLIHRAANRDPAATSPRRLLGMVTRNGARALGIPGGTVEPGAPGDLVIVDLHRVGSWPSHDPLDCLVFAATSEVVDSVLVGGELLLEGRRATHLDERRVLADAASVAADVVRSVGLDTWVAADRGGAAAGT